MKKELKYFLFFILLIYGSPLYSQSNYKIAEGYSFIIRGSSNIRDWAESADDVEGIASVNRVDDMHFDITEVRLLIRANAIRSIGVEGDAMNNKTYETLKVNQYPWISLFVTSPVKYLLADRKKRFIEIPGALIIAGVTKIIILHPVISADKQGWINVEGDVFLKMSDFGLKPPVTLFGVLRVTDEVAVHFKLSMIPDRN